MKTRNAWLLSAVLLIVAAGVVLTGCESTGTTDSAITITGSSSSNTGSSTNTTGSSTNITSQAAMTITGKGTVTLTASAGGGADSTTSLALPLVWTVSDVSLGDIKSSAGVTAIYQSTGKAGNNVISVRDQGDSEGVAVVTQQ